MRASYGVSFVRILEKIDGIITAPCSIYTHICTQCQESKLVSEYMPEPGAKAKRQWSQVGWMLIHHRHGLWNPSFRLILDSSVGLWVDIQSAGDLLSQTSKVRIQHSGEEDNLSLFDWKIACLCQSIKIKATNTHICTQCQESKFVNMKDIHSVSRAGAINYIP